MELTRAVGENIKRIRKSKKRSMERLAADFWNGVNNRAVTNMNILSDRNVQIRESEGNRIVVIEVPRADRHDKPVYIGSDPFAGTYRRNGEGDYRCTREEALACMPGTKQSARTYCEQLAQEAREVEVL